MAFVCNSVKHGAQVLFKTIELLNNKIKFEKRKLMLSGNMFQILQTTLIRYVTLIIVISIAYIQVFMFETGILYIVDYGHAAASTNSLVSFAS